MGGAYLGLYMIMKQTDIVIHIFSFYVADIAECVCVCYCYQLQNISFSVLVYIIRYH